MDKREPPRLYRARRQPGEGSLGSQGQRGVELLERGSERLDVSTRARAAGVRVVRELGMAEG